MVTTPRDTPHLSWDLFYAQTADSWCSSRFASFRNNVNNLYVSLATELRIYMYVTM